MYITPAPTDPPLPVKTLQLNKEIEAFQQCLGPCRQESLIQCTGSMRIEIVHHQGYLDGVFMACDNATQSIIVGRTRPAGAVAEQDKEVIGAEPELNHPIGRDACLQWQRRCAVSGDGKLASGGQIELGDAASALPQATAGQVRRISVSGFAIVNSAPSAGRFFGATCMHQLRIQTGAADAVVADRQGPALPLLSDQGTGSAWARLLRSQLPRLPISKFRVEALATSMLMATILMPSIGTANTQKVDCPAPFTNPEPGSRVFCQRATGSKEAIMIHLKNFNITVEDDPATFYDPEAIYVLHDGKNDIYLSIHGGTLTTKGGWSRVVQGVHRGTGRLIMTLRDVTLSSKGTNSWPILAQHNGVGASIVTVEGGSITTSGDYNWAIHSKRRGNHNDLTPGNSSRSR